MPRWARCPRHRSQPRLAGEHDPRAQARLLDHHVLIFKDRFRYAHRWSVGDVVYWDNQAVLHARSAFDPNSRRVFKRISLAGSRPF